MENYFYTCNYCGREYKPARRKVQKYCSNSCRTRAHVLQNPKQDKLAMSTTQIQQKSKKVESAKTESMSWVGIGNAAAGTLAVNALSSLFTNDENKPATKKDINDVKNLISRFHPVKNLTHNRFGNAPFYDVETKSIVYLKTN